MRGRPALWFANALVGAFALSGLEACSSHATRGDGVAAKGGPHVRLVSNDGDGPFVLRAKNGGYVGDFQILNDGSVPLNVLRVALRGESDDPVSPPHVFVSWSGGVGEIVTLAPREARTVTVAWMPDRHPRVWEAFGQVVVTTNDEAQGEIAKGFVGHNSDAPFVSRMRSWVLPIPAFIGAVMLSLALALRRERWRRIAVSASEWASFATVTLFALLLPFGITRRDGNDGLAFVDHVVVNRSWGVELFTGLDAVGVAFAFVIGLTMVVTAERTRSTNHASEVSRLVLFGALLAVVTAQDLVSILAWTALAFGSIATLFSERESKDATAAGGPRGATLPVALVVAFAALASAAFALHAKGTRTFLSDGTTVFGSWALPELRRAGDVPSLISFLTLNQLSVGALLVLLLTLTPCVPFHHRFIDTLERWKRGGGELVLAVAVLGPGIVLRAGSFAVADALARVAAPLAILALAGGLYAAIQSLRASQARTRLLWLIVAEANAAWLPLLVSGLSAAGVVLSEALVRTLSATVALQVCGSARMSRGASLTLAAAVLVLAGIAPPMTVLGLFQTLRSTMEQPVAAILFAELVGCVTLLAALSFAWNAYRGRLNVHGTGCTAMPEGPSIGPRTLGDLLLTAALLSAMYASAQRDELTRQVGDWLRTSV